MSGGCADAAREGAGITSHPRAEILASCAAQPTASSRPMPDAETALLLYDRYFPGNKLRPVSDLAGFPCGKQGLRAVMPYHRPATSLAARGRCRSCALTYH